MNTYAAFLRGINLGGRRIKMDELRAAFDSFGFPGAQTLLASGNVVFETDEARAEKVKQKIETGLQETFGYEVPVILRTAAQIKELVDSEPFQSVETTKDTRLNITFFAAPPEHDLKLPYESPGHDFTILAITPTHLVSALTLGPDTGTLDLMDFLGKQFSENATTRTWNTVLKVYAKMGAA